jgi:hypothetical protein
MFFDEEGDLAHEFYEEVHDNQTSHQTMRQCFNIKPQVGHSFKQSIHLLS